MVSKSDTHIHIDSAQQLLTVYQSQWRNVSYPISTSVFGMGEGQGSYRTPRGSHIIRAKIGKDVPCNGVFVGRRYTHEIYSPDLAVVYPERDWILSRVLWLSGCEIGFNRLGSVDTMHRYIYIHGTPESEPMGTPASHGCIRMTNKDVIELFELVEAGCPVEIT
jgi:lipoprotein-anchoring transpeptidase ErfK/SrfK